jgi:uncharacterized protein (TIGR02147 family)
MATASDYREILRDQLNHRIESNPRYSLRAFARDLGLSPSRLSEILNGKQGLSRASAQKIAGRMGFSFDETNRFCDLVESLHARSRLSQEVAKARLQKYQAEQSHRTLQLDAFRVVSDWYHFAILCLIELDGFDPDPDWIGRKLQISRYEATAALARLERLDLIEKTKTGYRVLQDFVASPSGIPSEAIRKFHRQVLEKAAAALTAQPLDDREFSTVLFALDATRLEEAKSKVRHFGRGLVKSMDSSRKKNRVYCLSMQLFRISEKGSP